ncbi:23S rRNA (pseudouridine(1915)-N(3))-methyltransferase RlmH [Facklamia sp. DSM 111018]|uniref:Ribosomal RNA large subunit methyltransferase H n=1 Tax=Facklamia lactis TaxID=2749967 RepID=A0ABS0LQY5_9LACT|nr:23S rRNA (pseudouridine(1915)-N(3))-methyltransferase RlmH [Facklamia lactis]MBG9980757.1 23S rRNA (pseudouridine(1915)-N(3))-methyltransferase RlmH [Facklamia lactis]MBG9986571.1 23S rRNA (pseudouridine(1915)-N(3))-methyltransferase RlmH [Facklamia lactis]
MKIDIICVGKLKEKYYKQGVEEYLKRLGTYANVTVHEVNDEPTKEEMSAVERDRVLALEAERIKKKISPQHKVVVLAIEGKLISSEDLANQLDAYATYGQSKICFIIGGSLGLATSLKQEADWSISFGRITLPHQLMRVVLVEQIYRAYRIINGHAYHK